MTAFKTWADFAQNYSMVLFNNCVNLGDSEVLQEWAESHTCEPDEPDECRCEPMQWYAMAINELDMEHLNKEYNLDIFYSEVLQLYILPVYHYGTSWTHVNIK